MTRLVPAMAAAIALGALAQTARAQQAYLLPPPATTESAHCDYFSRIHRFTVLSKSLCDEGRKVQPGPVTLRILQACRTEQGAAFDRLPVDDLMADFSRQIRDQGLGNACHAVKVQVWDLIQQ